MNNTKNILLIAAITSLLIMGTTIIPMQSYAGENKNTKDSKSSIKASTEVDKKSASQKLDQDNFCYRSDDCEQANQGQQIVGKDNEAKGFNDQSKNLALSSSSTGTGTPPTTPPTPPPPTTCVECFRSVLNPTEIDAVEDGFDLPLADICLRVEGGIDEIVFITSLLEDGISIEKIAELIKCLKAIGVVFGR